MKWLKDFFEQYDAVLFVTLSLLFPVGLVVAIVIFA